MKIAIPVDEKMMTSTICQSFGRAPYFLVYDTESKESNFVDNSAAVSQGGAGIKAAQSLIDSKVNVLLTPRCGENAAEVLSTASIKIYQTIRFSIMDTIDDFQKDKLHVLDEIHPGLHGHEGK
jgi:predicted Fe-Mo cluster-binding NifX family protein